MAESTPLMVRADLRERIEALATERGQSVDEVLEGLLPALPDTEDDNWVTRLVSKLETFTQEPNTESEMPEQSREHFETYLREKWARIDSDPNEAADANHSG